MSESFKVEYIHDVAFLTFDQPASKVNTLGSSTLTDLETILASLGTRHGTRGLLVRSGKPGQCIAGADLREIVALSEVDTGSLRRFIDLGHSVFKRLESLPFPTVGIVNGPALGGGLELLLSCDELLAVDTPMPVMGWPEVKLGLMPAWGGTQRLPRRIGVEQALSRLITGEPMSAIQALSSGLVHKLVGDSSALDDAVCMIRDLSESGTLPDLRQSRQA